MRALTNVIQIYNDPHVAIPATYPMHHDSSTNLPYVTFNQNILDQWTIWDNHIHNKYQTLIDCDTITNKHDVETNDNKNTTMF